MENEDTTFWVEHPNKIFIDAIIKAVGVWIVVIIAMYTSGVVCSSLGIAIVGLVGIIVGLYYSIMVYVSAWNMLKYKNRSSLWFWLFSLFVLIGFGLIGAVVLLCLKSKAGSKPVIEEQVQTIAN